MTILYKTTLVELRRMLLEAVAKLPKNRSVAVRMYFGLEDREYTIKEISKVLKVSRERARQLIRDGVRKLRITCWRIVPKLLVSGDTANRQNSAWDSEVFRAMPK